MNSLARLRSLWRLGFDFRLLFLWYYFFLLIIILRLLENNAGGSGWGGRISWDIAFNIVIFRLPILSSSLFLFLARGPKIV